MDVWRVETAGVEQYSAARNRSKEARMRMSPKSPKRFACLLALAALVLVFNGCKKSNDAKIVQEPALTKGSGHAQVSYQPNVKLMSYEEGQNALIGVGSDGAALLFDASDATARALKAGDVLVVKGLVARTVLGAQVTPDGVIVLTQQATIPEVIQEGDVTVEAPVRFGEESASAAVPAKEPSVFARSWTGTVYAQSPDAERAKQAENQGSKDATAKMIKGAIKDIIEDWKVNFSAKPEPGKVNLDLTLTRSEGGFEALITGKGYISDFDFSSNMGVHQSKMEHLETSFKNLTGQMNFHWEVAKDSAGVMAEESKIKLPGVIQIPLWKYLDGLPLYLEISSAILIHPAITGGKEVTKGSFRISYDGFQHFSVKSGSLDSDGKMNGNIEEVDQENISAVAPLGMVVAFSAPRFELTLGLSKILDTKNIQKAADYVDKIADIAARALLGADKYAQFKAGPLGQFKLGGVLKNALSTSGAVSLQFIATSATSYTGMSAITPCSRSDLHFNVTAGASAVAWGQTVGSLSKEIYKKDFSKVNPPGMKLCEDIK